MPRPLDELAREKAAYVASDGTGFRRAARTLQSVWRERQGLPMGRHNGVPLGSRLPIDIAEHDLANYLTDGIKGVVRNVLASAADSQLISRPRIYNDLLSSQPLCFNLFGEMKLDLDLATAVMRGLRPGSIRAVTHVGFEYSPQRSSDRFTADRSAFDVFVEYETPLGQRGFLGLEVKYHETLQDRAAAHRSRYDEVASAMGCFRTESLPRLRKTPLQQIWRDHLLAGSMLGDSQLGYAEGAFVLVYPAANYHCRSAMQGYRRCLTDTASFDVWTLEEIVAILGLTTQNEWVEEFRKRYLDFAQLAAV